MRDLFAYACERKVGDVLPMVGGMRVINGDYGCLNYHVHLSVGHKRSIRYRFVFIALFLRARE